MSIYRNTLLSVIASCVSVQVHAEPFHQRLSQAAIERTQHAINYDPAYVSIPYPNGDVPSDTGVCSDVVVRSLRTLEIDLQQLIHEDMKANFSAYPNHWGLKRTDRNIDHRRVPNIETYLTRHNMRLPPSNRANDYLAGDIVAWNLKGEDGGWLPHIGIVTNEKSSNGFPLIVHNIGAGPQIENILFAWPITGRYRPDDASFQ